MARIKIFENNCKQLFNARNHHLKNPKKSHEDIKWHFSHWCPSTSQSPLSNVISYPSSLSHPTAYPVLSKLPFAIVDFTPIWHPAKCNGLLFFQITLQHQQKSVVHFLQVKCPHPSFLSILLPHPVLGHLFVVRAISRFVAASFSQALCADAANAWIAAFFCCCFWSCFFASILRKCWQSSVESSRHI